MRYLLDTLTGYEEDHSFALFPVNERPAQSLLGESDLVRPLTILEHRESQDQFQRSLQGFKDEILTALLGMRSPYPLRTAGTLTSDKFNPGSSGISPSSSRIPSHMHQGVPSSSSAHSVSPVSMSCPSRPILPSAGAYIPRLPSGHQQEQSWRALLDNWYEVNPITGLALKDWPNEWINGRDFRGINATNYRNRKLLATEYELYVLPFDSIHLTLSHLLSAMQKMMLHS